MQNKKGDMENSQGNKPQREHIQAIYEAMNKPSVAFEIAINLSNEVIETSLSGGSKFLWEILQNADDAYEDQHKTIKVNFILKDKYLIVNHNGKGFDFNDVKRICHYASKIKVKATDSKTTGYKGIGFKSLFNLSDCIYIHSNGYSFRFDKGHWKKPETILWQVTPIWCEYNELPLYQNYPHDQPVNIILKINDAAQLESQLRELVDKHELFLFLFRINEIGVSLNEENHSLERRKEKFGGFNKIDFVKDKHIESTWLSKDYKLPVSKEVHTFLQGASLSTYPEKVKNAKEVSVTFALRSDNALTEISRIRGLCYSTLPTQLDLNLPYHINSQFILNLDRTQLHENKWNEFLIEQLGYLQFKLLKDLAGIEYLKNYVIQLFVREIKHNNAQFGMAFLKGFKLASGEIGWLPPHQGRCLLKLGEVWTDEIEFFKQNFQNIRNHKIYPYLINYEVKDQNYLSKHEAKHFSYDQLFRDFHDKYFPQLTRAGYLNFIIYLYERFNNRNSRAIDQLKNLCFLVAKDGTLVSPRFAFLEETENPVPNFLMLNSVDDNYLPANSDLIKDWLAQLGARRLTTPIQVLRESVLKWIDSGNFDIKLKMDNHVGIVNYLAQGFDQFTKRETEKLKERLLILTESKQFKLAKFCYFPDTVTVKELTDIVSDDEKISSSYDITNLREFFSLVGVTSRLKPIDVLRKSIIRWVKNGDINHKLTKDNYKPIIEYIAFHFPSLENTLTESEITEIKKMPILTSGPNEWNKAHVCYFDSAVPNVKGLEGVVAKNKLVSNISESVRKFLEKLGVCKTMAPIDVIRKSILKWIQEGDISNRITENNHLGILIYIGENWSNLTRPSGLKMKERGYLKNLPILTEGGVFKAASRCYWSNSNGSNYDEIPGLENVVSPDELVHSVYHSRVTKYLLDELGVHNLGFTDICERYTDHLKHSDNLKWFFSQLVNYWKRNKNNKDRLLKCLQQKLLSSPCLLAKNGKMYSSRDIYSSQFNHLYDINRNSILLLQYEKLPDDLEKYLGFKTELDLICIKQLLIAIGTKTDLGKAKTRIFFTTILEQLRKKDKNEIVTSQLSLLSSNNKLRLAKDLYYFINENASCYLKSSYLKRISDMSHKETLELAELCGVNTMPFKQDINQVMDDERPDDSLKEFYLERLPFIVLQESRTLNENVTSTFNRLYDAIYTIMLYQCHTIHVEYPFGATTIKKHFEGQTIYVVGKWLSQKTKIHDYLSRTLGIETDISEILDMEQPTNPQNKKDWIESQEEDPEHFHFVENLLENKGKDQLDITFPSVCREPNTSAPASGEPTTVAPSPREPSTTATDLDLKSIKQLLRAIDTKAGQDKTLIFFTTILKQLRQKDKNEIIKSQLSLISSDNKLRLAKNLNYFIEENASCSLKSCYLKRIVGMSHDETLELAELCGVNTIPFQHEIIGEKEKPDDSLREFYLERLPFIALQESKNLYKDIRITLKRLYDAISAIKFYQCHIIHVKYPFGDITNVQHHFEGLTLYVVGKWYIKRNTIHEYLKEKLGLKTDIRDILDMGQPLSENDKKYWLSSQREDPRELHFVENLLRSFMSSKEEGQLYKLSPDEIIQNDQPHHPKYEDNKDKVHADFTDTESSSDENLIVDDDDYHYTQKPNVIEICDSSIDKLKATPNYKVSTGGELTNAESSSEEISAKDVYHYLQVQKPNLIKDKGEVCDILIDKLKFTSNCEVSIGYSESSSDDEISADDKDDFYFKNTNVIISKGEASGDSIESEEIIDLLPPCPILGKLETDRKKRLLIPEIIIYNSSIESPKTRLSKILPEVSETNAQAKLENEKYVFIFLQQHYRKKYPNSICTSNNGIFTLQQQLNEIEIIWINASGEKGHSYDILLKKQDEIKRLIEVKSTNNMANKKSFNISHRKFIKKSRLSAESSNHKEKYCIYLVFNTSCSATPNVEELNSSAALYKVVLQKSQTSCDHPVF